MTSASRAYERLVVSVYSEMYGAQAWHWPIVSTDTLLASGWLQPEDIAERRRRRLLKDGTHQEFGLDGIGLRPDGGYDGLQAKRWLQGTLNHEELGSYGFAIMAMQHADPRNGGVLYHAPGSRVTDNVLISIDCPRRNMRVHQLAPMDHEQEEVAHGIDETLLTMRPSQQEALAFLAEHSRVVLAASCAFGKTLIFATHALVGAYDVVVIAAPLIASADQDLRRIAAFLPEHKKLAFWSGSGATLDEDRLTAHLKEPKIVIGTTFKSAGEVHEALKKCAGRKVLVLIDEAHNLNDSEDGPSARTLAFEGPSDWHVVLATATPSSVLKETIDVGAFDEFRYPLWRAIQDGSCTDYTISLPLVTDNATRLPVELAELEVGEDEWDAMGRAVYHAGTMLHDGARRSIVYCSSKAECAAYEAAFAKVCTDFLGVDCWTARVTDDVGTNERNAILKEFQQPDDGIKLRIVTSVRILDEAIDVPKCDSVFVTSVAGTVTESSGTRIVQRISRAIRLDAENPSKVARVYLWPRDSDDDAMGQLLWTLKQSDADFIAKVRYDYVDHDRARGDAAVDELCCKELEAWVDKWSVRAIRVRDLIEMKVQALCTEFRDRAPKYGETFKIDYGTIDIGKFLLKVSCNWSEQKHAHTFLTAEQKTRIENACSWFLPRLTRWQKRWAESKKYQPSVHDKVIGMCTLYGEHPPRRGVPASFTTAAGDDFWIDYALFLNVIAYNWNPGKKALNKLTHEDMQTLENECKWMPDQIKTWRKKWVQQAEYYQPTVEDKVHVLCTQFSMKAPQARVITTAKTSSAAETFLIDAGAFFYDAMTNWNPYIQTKTRLSAEQMARIESSCTWFAAKLAKLRQNWEKKKATTATTQ